MPRIEFSAKTRSLIAASAGNQCSFPACNRRTCGPGPSAEVSSSSGFAAHIYSASSNGPRGQGGLSEEELKSAANGIWLCGVHNKIVDNNQGVEYPEETLLSYKSLHEARIRLEHEGLYSPVGWIHELKITNGILFSTPQVVQLGKLNLIIGPNGTGKTAIAEWIMGFFNPEKLRRWTWGKPPRLNLELSILTPKLERLRLCLEEGRLRFQIGSAGVAFIPMGFKMFQPSRPDGTIEDDKEMLALSLGVSELVLDELLEEVNTFEHAHVSNLRFEPRKDDDGNETEVLGLVGDVHGTPPGLPFRCLSSRERERVVIELSTAAARLSGKYCPTLLVLDGPISIFFQGFFNYYSHHLLDPINQFQTIMCVPEQDIDLSNLKWNGWQVIRTSGQQPNILLNQDSS